MTITALAPLDRDGIREMVSGPIEGREPKRRPLTYANLVQAVHSILDRRYPIHNEHLGGPLVVSEDWTAGYDG